MDINKLRSIIGDWSKEIEEETARLIKNGYMPYTALAVSVNTIKRQKELKKQEETPPVGVGKRY